MNTSSEQIAIVPGSFDPPTIGHLNLIERTSKLYETVYVVIAVNPSKTYTFSAEERKKLIDCLIDDYPNVHSRLWNRLIVDYAKSVNSYVIVRGVRTVSDFGYEMELAHMNKALNGEIETVFLPTELKYGILRSSSIKDLIRMNGDVTRMLPSKIYTKVISLLNSKGKTQ